MTAVETAAERAGATAHRNADVLLVDDRQENLLALEAILEPHRARRHCEKCCGAIWP